MQNHVLELAETNVYRISKKLFWFVLFILTAIFIVLLISIIYFDVNRKTSNSISTEASTTSTSTVSQSVTTTVPNIPVPMVQRVPEDLQQLSYELIIIPDLIAETFTGNLLYTFICLKATHRVILHMVDLRIEHKSIQIVESSSNSTPIFLSECYDSYNQFITFTFTSVFTPANNYTLFIAYTGSITYNLKGIYMSHYINTNGSKGTFMASSMEPTFARRVLPCIDEAARKAIFQINIVHDSSYTAWSNGEIRRKVKLDDRHIRSSFTPTPKMSTFLLAFIVAPKAQFACLPDRLVGAKKIKSRVCGHVNILPQLTYADQMAYKILQFFNTYLDMDYPLSKIEHFAVRDFADQGMENYGLVMYDELELAFDERIMPSSKKQDITLLIAHEIAHQWFGNLVTPAWWNELWLKEGFARYLETLASDFVQPLWMLEKQFPVETTFAVMAVDLVPTTRSISSEATSLSAISDLYDTITYNKGATLVRMMSMILGAETFQQGLRTYLKASPFSSVTQQDLWKHLNAAPNNTIDLEQIMQGWTRQEGYPVVKLQRIYSTANQTNVAHQMRISQQPFSLFSSKINRKKWWIPFQYFDRTFNELKTEGKFIWLNNTSAMVTVTTPNSEWILANPNYLGLYRTMYDPQNFALILAQLQTDHTRIPTLTRAGLLDDAFALSYANLINIIDAYDLIRYLKNETKLLPWIAALSAMKEQERLFSDHEILLDIQHYFLERMLPIYNEIGWTPVNQSVDWLRALLQPKILSAVCHYGHEACIESARRIFRMNPSLNSIPVNLRLTVYCTVVREGSPSDFHFFWTRLQHESVLNEVVTILEALSCSRDPSAIRWFLNQHLKNDISIREQDIVSSIENLAHSSQANQIVWDWFRDHWTHIHAKWGKSEENLSRIVGAILSQFVTVRQQEELRAFARSITNQDTLHDQLRASDDTIDADIEWSADSIASLVDFFFQN